MNDLWKSFYAPNRKGWLSLPLLFAHSEGPRGLRDSNGLHSIDRVCHVHPLRTKSNSGEVTCGVQNLFGGWIRSRHERSD